MTKIKTLKRNAIDEAMGSLANGKFMLFGYWASIWDYLNKIDSYQEPNPFRELTKKAQEMQR